MNPKILPAHHMLHKSVQRIENDEVITDHECTAGMTLRDAFAIAALQGTLANDVCMREMFDFRGYVDLDLIADHSYTIADAMLKRRQS